MSGFDDARVQLLIIILGLPVLGGPVLLQLFVLALLGVLMWLAAVRHSPRMPEQITGTVR